MGKIIEINNNLITIGMPDGSMEEVRAGDINFVPHVGDEVEIFKTETRTIVSKVEKKNETTQGININLSQNQGTMGGSMPNYVGGKGLVEGIIAVFKPADGNGNIVV